MGWEQEGDGNCISQVVVCSVLILSFWRRWAEEFQYLKETQCKAYDWWETLLADVEPGTDLVSSLAADNTYQSGALSFLSLEKGLLCLWRIFPQTLAVGQLSKDNHDQGQSTNWQYVRGTTSIIQPCDLGCVADRVFLFLFPCRSETSWISTLVDLFLVNMFA